MGPMKIKRIIFGFLALALLSCNFVTKMIIPPTATPVPTFTSTGTITASPPPTATPLQPAYIPPQCDSNAPLPTISPDVFVHPTLQFETEEISKREQLRVINEIERTVEEMYIYPDYNGMDWNAIVSQYREKVEAGLDTETFYYEMQSLISELGDDHSSFISPAGVKLDEAMLKGQNEFVGIGVISDVNFENGQMTVLSVYPGSPAEQGGLKPHDSILLVDGFPTTQDGGIRTLGPECTSVVLTVQSPGGSPREMIMVRTKIEGNIPVESRLVSTADGSKIGYISIPSFFDNHIPRQVEDALKEFGELDGLILDVRFNSGGSLAIGESVLELFTDGKMGDFVNRKESYDYSIRANPVFNSQTVPLVVIVNDGSASFSEIFAGLLRDVRSAKITGQTSLGNVEVLNRYVLDDGSWLWLASSTFDSAHSDINWEQIGIVPDIEAYAPWETFTFDTDPSIAAALELLGHE